MNSLLRNVIEYLKESARTFPKKKAFVDEHKSLTFAEVDMYARSIANSIGNKCNVGRNRPIVVYLDKSVDVIVSFLGIVYSGNIYSPIDTKMPKERINNILHTLNPIAVIEHQNKLLDVNTECMSIIYEEAIFEKNVLDLDNNLKKILDIDPLYILFTSGSTGIPKGVTISHRGVIDYTEWLKDKFDFDNNTVFGNQAPFYFDNSILDIYSTLKNGSTMVIIPEKLFMFTQKLLEYINLYKINTIFWVPSALIGVANSNCLESVHLDNIEKILFCGEVMPNKQLNIWRRHYPNVLYANLYGPTEITDVCTYYIVDREFDDDEPLPIGKACENMDVLVLNDRDEEVTNEESGELCVRGVGISMGYYGNCEKTNLNFVQNPLNTKYHEWIYRTGDIVKYNEYGELIYLCRKDYQIKHQGHRIELGEIEVAASSIEGIFLACALYDDVHKKIVLFYTGVDDFDEKSVYKQLKAKVPGYMLPGTIKHIEHFTLNANGKIDRVVLKGEM